MKVMNIYGPIIRRNDEQYLKKIIKRKSIQKEAQK